jgi:hypothetical protein
MVKMKTQQNKTDPVENVICRNFEELIHKGIKVFGISYYNTQLNKVEIEEVNKQENKDAASCPYHKTGEE